MTRGEKWKQFFAEKGWIKNGIVEGSDSEKIILAVQTAGDAFGRKCAVVEKALVLEDQDILCYECSSGTVYFQWDDIVQVRQEPKAAKKGWL